MDYWWTMYKFQNKPNPRDAICNLDRRDQCNVFRLGTGHVILIGHRHRIDPLFCNIFIRSQDTDKGSNAKQAKSFFSDYSCKIHKNSQKYSLPKNTWSTVYALELFWIVMTCWCYRVVGVCVCVWFAVVIILVAVFITIYAVCRYGLGRVLVVQTEGWVLTESGSHKDPMKVTPGYTPPPEPPPPPLEDPDSTLMLSLDLRNAINCKYPKKILNENLLMAIMITRSNYFLGMQIADISWWMNL